MSPAARRTSRSRQNTIDGTSKTTKQAAEKRSKSTEKPTKTRATRKTSRSASRSPARQKAGAKKSTAGTKVYTKKELENSKRSGSVKRASSRSKSVERRAKRAQTPTKRSTEVEQLQMKYGVDNVNRNSYFEDDDIIASGPGRYSLRKRASPSAKNISSASPGRSSSSITITKRDKKSSSLCGYLCYKNNDCRRIIVATLVLLIALGIINYFHLVDLTSIQSCITKMTSGCCDCLKQTVRSVKTFFTNMFSRIVGQSASSST